MSTEPKLSTEKISTDKPVPFRKRYKCVLCSDSFKTGLALDDHCKLVHDNASFKCGLCLERFATEEDLKEHNTSHHQFACQLCSKILPTKSVLKLHFTATHPGETMLQKDSEVRIFFY